MENEFHKPGFHQYYVRVRQPTTTRVPQLHTEGPPGDSTLKIPLNHLDASRSTTGVPPREVLNTKTDQKYASDSDLNNGYHQRNWSSFTHQYGYPRHHPYQDYEGGEIPGGGETLDGRATHAGYQTNGMERELHSGGANSPYSYHMGSDSDSYTREESGEAASSSEDDSGDNRHGRHNRHRARLRRDFRLSGAGRGDTIVTEELSEEEGMGRRQPSFVSKSYKSKTADFSAARRRRAAAAATAATAVAAAVSTPCDDIPVHVGTEEDGGLGRGPHEMPDNLHIREHMPGGHVNPAYFSTRDEDNTRNDINSSLSDSSEDSQGDNYRHTDIFPPPVSLGIDLADGLPRKRDHSKVPFADKIFKGNKRKADDIHRKQHGSSLGHYHGVPDDVPSSHVSSVSRTRHSRPVSTASKDGVTVAGGGSVNTTKSGRSTGVRTGVGRRTSDTTVAEPESSAPVGKPLNRIAFPAPPAVIAAQAAAGRTTNVLSYRNEPQTAQTVRVVETDIDDYITAARHEPVMPRGPFGFHTNSMTSMTPQQLPPRETFQVESDAWQKERARRRRKTQRRKVCFISGFLAFVIIGIAAGSISVLYCMGIITDEQACSGGIFGSSGTTEPTPPGPTVNITNITFDGTVRLRRPFSSALNEPSSNEFIQLSGNFCSAMDSVYSNFSGYLPNESCQVSRFTSGSIRVGFRLEFLNMADDNTTATLAKDPLIKAVSGSSLGGFSVYNDSLSMIEVDKSTTPLPTTTTTLPPSTSTPDVCNGNYDWPPIRPVPHNCRRAYVCVSGTVPFESECPCGQFFNAFRAMCVPCKDDSACERCRNDPACPSKRRKSGDDDDDDDDGDDDK